MMKFLLSFCLFFGLVGGVRAASDTITWSSQRLKWPDFKGKSDTAVHNKEHLAATLWKLTYFHRFNARTRQVEVIAYAWFDGRRSWVRPSQRTNAFLLQHEQGHFDLAEILARQFKKKIALAHFEADTYADSLQTLFSSLLADMNDAQLQYDVDTAFGEQASEQRRWQTYIATTLAQLNEYADKRVLSKAP